jgi:4-amino-4-deoxy-L-arabinose transferase-like glycosyltransferase
VAHVAAYLVVALSRMAYPFELEWMEGGVLEHVRMVLAGQPIYAPPSLQFISFLYPPLHYWIGAAAASVLGASFLTLRLVSFLASLGAFALIFLLVRRETGKALPGLVSACLFAAMFERSGGWFDLARVDSLFLVLLLGVIYVARFGTSASTRVAGGALVVAAFLAKQATAVVVVPVLALLFLRDRLRALPFVATAAIGIASAILYLQYTTGGWFGYYCLTLPANHPFSYESFAGFWTADLLAPLGIACVFSLFYLIARVTIRADRGQLFYVAFTVGAVVSSWSIRSKLWAEVNNLFPVYAAVSILAGLGLNEVRLWIGSDGGERRRVVELFVWTALTVQFASLAYDPRRLVPSAADREAGRSVVARIAAIEGEVWVPHHGYLASLAGKRAFAHTLAMDNVFLYERRTGRTALEEELWRAVEGRRFGAVLLDSDMRFEDVIGKNYEACEDLFGGRDVFWTVGGYRVRPAFLCVPKR